MCTLIRFLRFMGTFFVNPSLLLRWIFEHDCLDTCCFGCFICMCFIFLYFHFFGAIEYVMHRKALYNYSLWLENLCLKGGRPETKGDYCMLARH